MFLLFLQQQRCSRQEDLQHASGIGAVGLDHGAFQIATNEETIGTFDKSGFVDTTGAVEQLAAGIGQRVALTPPPAMALLTSASTAAWLTMVMSPGTS